MGHTWKKKRHIFEIAKKGVRLWEKIGHTLENGSHLEKTGSHLEKLVTFWELVTLGKNGVTLAKKGHTWNKFYLSNPPDPLAAMLIN